MDDRMLRSARAGTMRVGKGDLIKHLLGKRLTQREAIRAKCYDCNGMGEENTCDLDTCSLHPYSPYGLCKRKSPQHSPAMPVEDKTA
jgi:hypothetical protein